MKKQRVRSQTKLNSLFWLLVFFLIGTGQASGLVNDDFGGSSRDRNESQMNSDPGILQERITVTGTVTEDRIGIPGVSVSIKGTTQGTITDTNGKYSIVVPDQSSVLVFSFVGMITQEVTVGNQTVVDVELRSQMIGLDEIVVTGYSIRQRSQPTGAITRVVGIDIRESLIQAPDQALQGRMSGVLATSTSGQPGSGMQLLVRGRGSISASSAPVIIVDGVQVRTDFSSAIVYDNPLTSINPDDIESIEVRFYDCPVGIHC